MPNTQLRQHDITFQLECEDGSTFESVFLITTNLPIDRIDSNACVPLWVAAAKAIYNRSYIKVIGVTKSESLKVDVPHRTGFTPLDTDLVNMETENITH